MKLNMKSFKDKFKDKSRDEILEEMFKVYEEKEKLEKELKKYKNANTPSSMKKFDKPQALGLKVGRKKGKRTKHNGRTRPVESPTDTIDVFADRNPLTRNKNIEETGYTEEIIITDFQIVKKVIKYVCHEYRDLDTGEIFVARHPDMPDKGIFGKNVLAFTNFLRFKCRVPFSKIASMHTDVFDISMTAPTAMNICNRVSDKVSYKYEELKKAIRNEKVVNSDETGANKNGVPGWLWGFFSPMIALLVFNKKRGGDILERTLGKNFKGKLGCDGWATYVVYSKKFRVLLQRCWAHLIREVKHICKGDKELENAYTWIKDIFEKMKKARALKTERLRKQRFDSLVKWLDRWIKIYSAYTPLRKLANKVKNGKEFWFTCVLYPEIEPTNNRAERGLRDWVVLRKIIGCLRSDQGERTTEVMLSLFQTWALKNANPYEQLRTLL